MAKRRHFNAFQFRNEKRPKKMLHQFAENQRMRWYHLDTCPDTTTQDDVSYQVLKPSCDSDVWDDLSQPWRRVTLYNDTNMGVNPHLPSFRNWHSFKGHNSQRRSLEERVHFSRAGKYIPTKLDTVQYSDIRPQKSSNENQNEKSHLEADSSLLPLAAISKKLTAPVKRTCPFCNQDRRDLRRHLSIVHSSSKEEAELLLNRVIRADNKKLKAAYAALCSGLNIVCSICSCHTKYIWYHLKQTHGLRGTAMTETAAQCSLTGTSGKADSFYSESKRNKTKLNKKFVGALDFLMSDFRTWMTNNSTDELTASKYHIAAERLIVDTMSPEADSLMCLWSNLPALWKNLAVLKPLVQSLYYQSILKFLQFAKHTETSLLITLNKAEECVIRRIRIVASKEITMQRMSSTEALAAFCSLHEIANCPAVQEVVTELAEITPALAAQLSSEKMSYYRDVLLLLLLVMSGEPVRDIVSLQRDHIARTFLVDDHCSQAKRTFCGIFLGNHKSIFCPHHIYMSLYNYSHLVLHVMQVRSQRTESDWGLLQQALDRSLCTEQWSVPDIHQVYKEDFHKDIKVSPLLFPLQDSNERELGEQCIEQIFKKTWKKLLPTAEAPTLCCVRKTVRKMRDFVSKCQSHSIDNATSQESPMQVKGDDISLGIEKTRLLSIVWNCSATQLSQFIADGNLTVLEKKENDHRERDVKERILLGEACPERLKSSSQMPQCTQPDHTSDSSHRACEEYVQCLRKVMEEREAGHLKVINDITASKLQLLKVLDVYQTFYKSVNEKVTKLVQEKSGILPVAHIAQDFVDSVMNSVSVPLGDLSRIFHEAQAAMDVSLSSVGSIDFDLQKV